MRNGPPGTDCHPVLAEWFRDKFGRPTDIQRRTWEPVTAGEHVLLAAPTGSGKTLAALLPCLNRIVRARSGTDESAEPGVRLLYVTPLKALNNDIHDHLLGFVRELEPYGRRHEERTGEKWDGIRAGVRTGDTTQSTRASMLRHPPDVLVTTPESLFILLASEKARRTLRTVRQVIVDEIHDLAEDKRGMHLSLSLERLDQLCGRPVQRIGVSATIHPMERVARYLGGWGEPGEGEAAPPQGEDGETDSIGSGLRPRPVTIVRSDMAKTFDITVTLAEMKAASSRRSDIWDVIAARLMELMEGCRSVIVFVNNRRLCERVTLHLNDLAGYETARSHHGSVSRERRLETEKALKEGGLRCLVATSSLELGIDVGHVDLVIQIDSPQSAASGIQRIGRAGHSVGDVSRGVILVRHRGQLAECAVLAREIADRRIEEIRIPDGTIDVFCQHAAAMAGTDEWTVDGLLALVARSDSFRNASRDRLVGALDVLSGYYPHCRPLLEWDRDANVLRGLRSTASAVLTGAGTIPQSSAYPVYLSDSRVHIGELDEEYVHESRIGDVFQLGTSSYRIASIKGDRIYATEVKANAFSEIPFWRGDGPGRSFGLSRLVGELLRELEKRIAREASAATASWLTAEYRLDRQAAESLVAYVEAQLSASALPHDRKIVVEHYEDDVKRHHLVLHTMFGRRTNRTWLLAMQRWFETRVPAKLYAYVRDNGIEFVFREWDPAYASSWMNVHEDNVEELLAEAIPSSPLFGVTFRHLAQTSLLLARGFTRVPLWKQRMRSERLLEESLPYADRFPFIRETMRTVLRDSLEPERVRELLRGIRTGDIAVDIRNTAFPSPFAAQFVWDTVNTLMYESDAVPQDIQYRLLSVSKKLAGQYFEPSAFQGMIDAEEAQAWIDGGYATGSSDASPSAYGEAGGDGDATDEDAEEGTAASGRTYRAPSPAERLYRLLKRQGDLTAAEIRTRLGEEADAKEAVAELARRGTIRETTVGGEPRWICADEAATYEAFPDDSHAAAFVLRRYAERQIAFTAEQLDERYAIGADRAAAWIRQWAEDGTIERSPFARSPEEPIWTSRSAASRLLRFTVGQMRRRSEPAEPDRYCRLLFGLQHVLPDTRLSGIDGLRQVIGVLQGVFLPVSHWESFVFPARVTDYRKDMLDLLCAGGETIWVGRKDEGEKEGRVAFFMTDAQGLQPPAPPETASAEPELLSLLRSKGASFLTALSRDTGLPPSGLVEKLLRLVWEGRVSNDQFAPIRMHGTGSGAKSGSGGRKGFQSGLGRWYAVSEAPIGHSAQASAGSGEGETEKSIVAWIHRLVQSYGIVTRDMLASRLPGEADRLPNTIRKLEDWGMLVRGFWIKGVPYMQMSTAETVDKLKQPAPVRGGETIVLSAVDPANPYGTLLKWPDRPGASFARKAGNFLVFRDGRWVLWIESNGKRFVTMEDGRRWAREGDHAMAEVVSEAVRIMMRLSGLRKIVVDSWDGTAAALTEAADSFRAIGAEADRNAFVIWPSGLKGV
ncbi:DEAD/DEAH box helicase [Paenibacillus flagellatus]|uniref:DEAD/DEAH box helicase n=2 Tax=Paenibacillus flagellatus TaxID=2211139 RepID=A0A2V5KAX3_9BACL|nr:DEAD/DEAH box helicase [Paenibacillus flagellatus]